MNFLYGFFITTGVNQILLTPCILLHTSFNVAFWLVIIANLLIFIVSIFYCKRVSYKKIEMSFITIIVIAIVVFQIIMTTINEKANADDSFYISLSTLSLQSENIYMEEPSMGYKSDESLMTPIEQLPSIELQIAIFSKIANITPAMMCHSVLPACMIFMAYIAFYYFARSMMNEEDSKTFLIILSIILMFTAFSTKFRTGCLLIKTWQGKAMFLNIAIPFILGILIRIIKNNNSKYYALLALANIVSISLTSSAIFLIPFMYLPVGIIKLVRKKWKEIIKLVISFIPVIIYVLIMICISNGGGELQDLQKETIGIIECCKYYNSNIYFVYYFISTILILIFGNKKMKIYFGIVQGINLITIWNPLLSNIISKYFTSALVFWRVLWLLPIEFAIATMVVVMAKKIRKPIIKIIFYISILMCIVLSGKFVYKAKIVENLENIPEYVLSHTKYILEKGKEKNEIVVLASPETGHSITMRQITSKIKLIFSRDLYIEKIKNEIEIEQRRKLNQIFYGNFLYEIEEFNQVIDDEKIDWVIVDKKDENLIQYISKSDLIKEVELDGYELYCNKQK